MDSFTLRKVLVSETQRILTTYTSENESTAKLRTLYKVLQYLNMTLEDNVFPLQNKIFVHPQCSAALIELGGDNQLSKESIDMLQSSDYHESSELIVMANELEHMCPDKQSIVNYIFAVDGFHGAGTQFKNYTSNLKYQLKEDDTEYTNRMYNDVLAHYVYSVRELYKYTSDPIKIHETILETFAFDIKGDKPTELAKNYLDILKSFSLFDLTHHVRQKISKEVEYVNSPPMEEHE